MNFWEFLDKNTDDVILVFIFIFSLTAVIVIRGMTLACG